MRSPSGIANENIQEQDLEWMDAFWQNDAKYWRNWTIEDPAQHQYQYNIVLPSAPIHHHNTSDPQQVQP